MIGRFYSNDPVGFTASNPMMFNRYAYANNNPYKFVDPDGRHGRGVGWSDEDWSQVNEERQATADDIEGTASELRNLAADLMNGALAAGGYSSRDLVSMAANMEVAVAALRDDGTNGYYLHAGKMDSRYFGEATLDGKDITLNREHWNFNVADSSRFRHMLGHEALHNVGLAHPPHTGFTPYRYGNANQANAFKFLPQAIRPTSPDYIMKLVYP